MILTWLKLNYKELSKKFKRRGKVLQKEKWRTKNKLV